MPDANPSSPAHATIGDSAGRPFRVLVVIPAFNESASIGGVLETLRAHCPALDVVVVNDGSSDDTPQRARALGVRVLDLPINLGIGGAVQCGFKYAVAQGYDVCLQVDGDGQHDPRFIPKLLECMLREEADLVIGSRFLAGGGFQSTATRRAGIRALRWLIAALTGVHISDPTSGMRAYGPRVLPALARYYPQEYPEPECAFMLVRRGYRVVETPVQMHERHAGVSSIGPLASALYMLKVSLAIVLHLVSERLLPKEPGK